MVLSVEISGLRTFELTRKNCIMEFEGMELFLDDRYVSSMGNMRRVVQRAEMHPDNPLIKQDYPWEQGGVCLLGTAYYDTDRDLYQMWYMSVGKNYPAEKFMAYAESKDGIEWYKPLFDHNPYEDIKQTNIVFGSGFTVTGPSVLRNPDPNCDPGKRYLVLFNSYCREHPEDSADLGFRHDYVAYSPDGIHWSPSKGQPAFSGKADATQCAVWDPRAKVFHAYVRRTIDNAYGQRIRTWSHVQSPDFIEWGPARELLRMDDEDGEDDGQIQQLAITYYDGIFIGLLSYFRIEHYYNADGSGLEGVGGAVGFAERDKTGPDGPIDEGPQINDIQLLTSRDGVHFTRVGDREAFMPASRIEGLFSTTGHRTSCHMVQAKDEVRVYCDGRLRGWRKGFTMQIGLGSIRRDRFVAMEPSRKREVGVIELVPMDYPDPNLFLNATTMGMAYYKHVSVGTIRAEVVTFDGKAIEGFSKDDAVPIDGDSLDHPLEWTSDGNRYNLAKLPSQVKDPVRLRLWMHNAKVFALRDASHMGK